MISKPIDQITQDDINQLIESEMGESKTIEFKLMLPDNGDKGKKEFLADVSSFANAGGGDLIFGIKEVEGVAGECPGLENFNEDNDCLRIENSIRDGIAPRMPGVKLKVIEGFTNGPVLLIRIPRSWTGPHLVSFKNNSRFYTRNSKGKFQMDVGELRSAFDGMAEIPERIARWRDERLGRIVANEGPMRLSSNECLVFHLVPFDSIGNEWRFHGSELNDFHIELLPITGGSAGSRINVDGFMTFGATNEDQQETYAYTQLFRSGRIEAVTAKIIRQHSGQRYIASIAYEKNIIQSTSKYLQLLKKLGVQTPIAFSLSLLGAKNAFLYVNEFATMFDPVPIDRDVIIFPEIMIEDYDCDLPQVLRPVFDSVWNACGYPQSRNYNEEGEWNPK